MYVTIISESKFSCVFTYCTINTYLYVSKCYMCNFLSSLCPANHFPPLGIACHFLAKIKHHQFPTNNLLNHPHYQYISTLGWLDLWSWINFYNHWSIAAIINWSLPSLINCCHHWLIAAIIHWSLSALIKHYHHWSIATIIDWLLSSSIDSYHHWLMTAIINWLLPSLINCNHNQLIATTIHHQ